MITTKTKICMIIGDPVEHSLSPQMHNKAYQALGIEDEFVYVGSRVKSEKLQEAIDGIRALGIHGITVTIPHKSTVIPFLDDIDNVARKIGAVNTIINREGNLYGYNTDYIGVLTPIKKVTSITGKRVAIVGAGGFAKSAAYAMTTEGGIVTIYNRTLDHAKKIAHDMDCLAKSLDHIEELIEADIIIHASSVGLQTKESVIPKEVLHKNQIIMDAVYRPYETTFIKHGEEKGATIIHGTEILLYQGLEQFFIFTGKRAPEDIVRKEIMKQL